MMKLGSDPNFSDYEETTFRAGKQLAEFAH
jgi:hypothetical protein